MIHHQSRKQSCFFHEYPFAFLCPKAPLSFYFSVTWTHRCFCGSPQADLILSTLPSPLSYATIFSEYFNVLWKFIGELQLVLTVFQITNCSPCRNLPSYSLLGEMLPWKHLVTDFAETLLTTQRPFNQLDHPYSEMAEPCKGPLKLHWLKDKSHPLTSWPSPHFHGFYRVAHYRLWGLQLPDHSLNLLKPPQKWHHFFHNNKLEEQGSTLNLWIIISLCNYILAYLNRVKG